jgi:hypothetical protein
MLPNAWRARVGFVFAQAFGAQSVRFESDMRVHL